ncbi:TnsA-like heteromeric transposase endonuclease subunit [Kitasatospora aureofaciens]|uniref:TnsA-like heteromeric transposase endonuclease subunit n=1 Tax=Kitasatospora aureofaciens TaxID=1894 RepID=UPI0027DFAA87|nr:TnsA-like heteromeric transposase endonuclease subunit [Kitasatospora aureofaciens]
MWSHSCTLDDLVAPFGIDPVVAERLETGAGWARRWTATWKTAGADVICPVQGLAGVPALASVPVRGFTWRTGQRHRPGLQFLLATGRMHGFESLAERRLLLALDFTGGVEEVLSQPFRLRFTTADGAEDHTPDFLVLLPGTAVLIDVRPAHLIKEKDAVKFAAADRAAAAAGWRYTVATGWRRQVLTGLDALSARRRRMTDQLGLQSELMELVHECPRRFGHGSTAVSRGTHTSVDHDPPDCESPSESQA